jgi:ABC-type amino acid transport substrate-binding protein
VNIFKHILCAVTLFALVRIEAASVTCAAAPIITLNVGILNGNLPYSNVAVVGGISTAEGFDPLLVSQIAKRLGYTTVNFIVYANTALAEIALDNGSIDVYANSGNSINPTLLTAINFNGVVTDISKIFSSPNANGYEFATTCCNLALKFEQAINELVANGVYAQLLQAVRLAGHASGTLLGMPASSGVTGVLLEPFPFFSSEFGTINPSGCSATGPSYQISVLPTLSPISAYVLANFTPTITGAATGISG